jgi:hypothetical protein
MPSAPVHRDIKDPAFLAFLEHRIQRTAEDFDLDPAHFPRPVILIWRPDGPPMCVPLPTAPPGCLIFIQHMEDWWRARYQLSHEVVHALLCPDRAAFDWVQEMLATYIAVKAMHELGEYDYAIREEARLKQLSEEMPIQRVRELDLTEDYPPSVYGRVFMVASELEEAVGWEQLKRLGRMFDEQGKHNLFGWLDSLEEQERVVSARILEL